MRLTLLCPPAVPWLLIKRKCTYYSLLTTHYYSLLTTHYYSLLTTHYSLIITIKTSQLEPNQKEWIYKTAVGDLDAVTRLLLSDRSLVKYKDFVSGYTGTLYLLRVLLILTARVRRTYKYNMHMYNVFNTMYKL